MRSQAAYLDLFARGELAVRASLAREHEQACDLCGRYCRVDRRTDRLGACRTGLLARVASYGPHHGEEAPLRGRFGSGAIFFTWCNLRCQYCQNHDISQAASGHLVTSNQLAEVMLRLQASGCHNINFVSPSHVVAEILEALILACQEGLDLPLVYNTGGYDSPEVLALLDGVIDIYMPDMKYSQAAVARRYSGIRRYPSVNRAAVREMHRQVGDLVIGDDGLAVRGLLVRHLVLPGRLSGTPEIVRFLAQEISPNTYLNLMDQYRPAFNAFSMPPLDRRLTRDEFAAAVKLARTAGLTRLDGISA